MLGKLFGKKKEENLRNGFDMTIRDLQIGDFLDYDLKTWEVTAAYEYDWGNNFFTVEFQLDSGSEKIYVHLEQDDDLEITVTKKAKIFTINDMISDHVIEYDEPMKKFDYNGKTMYRDGESLAHCRELPEGAWSELVTWDFVDEQEETLITIERWGEQDIEASIGRYAEVFEFSNFTPRQQES